MKKSRRSFSSSEKAAIVKRHLVEGVPVSDLCDEFQLQPTQIYAWQKQLFDNAALAFERPRRRSKQLSSPRPFRHPRAGGDPVLRQV